MSTVLAIQYQSRYGERPWLTAIQAVQSVDDKDVAEPLADTYRRAGKLRAFYAEHAPEVQWRVWPSQPGDGEGV